MNFLKFFVIILFFISTKSLKAQSVSEIDIEEMKNRITVGLMEAFYGDFIYSYERNAFGNLWLEVGGGPTNLVFGQWHLIKSERFANDQLIVDSNNPIQNEYGKTFKIGVTYVTSYHEMGTFYYGSEFQYREVNFSQMTKQDGLHDNIYNFPQMKMSNLFYGFRAKVGARIYFNSHLNDRGYARSQGLDYSFGLGVAYLQMLRNIENIETEQYTGYNKFTYTQDLSSNIRPSFTFSIKLFHSF